MRDSLVSIPQGETEAFLSSLSHNALLSLPYLFEYWAHAHQLPPTEDFRTWVILGGRGSGKTRAGSEWVRRQVEGNGPTEPGRARRVALIAETLEQARDVMVFGDSGILACSPPDRCPRWVAGSHKLVWPNGAEAQTFSASNPEALRGPQFDAAWVDELAKWKTGRKAWDQLQFSLRLGKTPQQVVTTTPRRNSFLEKILKMNGTVVTHASTDVNEAFLADGFVEALLEQYGQTLTAREEIYGEIVEDAPGALWPRSLLDDCRRPAPDEFDRVVVAVDPPVTSGEKADTCGIVVAGAVRDRDTGSWRAWVLEDASVQGLTTDAWAAAAVSAYHKHGADRLVAEVNQGGDLVGDVIGHVDATVAFSPVRATRGKAVRAEPVAFMYERGKVHHVDVFEELEDQMAEMDRTGFNGSGSPDRVDALVWALTELLLSHEVAAVPSVRTLSR